MEMVDFRMKTFFIVASLLAVGLVLAEDSEEKSEVKDVKPWKKLDFKKREPEFLKEMSQDAKTAYFGIKFNPELTKAEKTRMLKEWADQYDVEDDMQKFLDAKKADCDKKKQERKDNYERLGDLIEKADEILDDQENTWNGANEKLEALVKDENRDVMKAFQSFYPFVGRDSEGPRHGHGHGHGHRFHHGRRFGRNIGGGAAPRYNGGGIGSGISIGENPRHHNGGIGSGISMGERHRDGESYDAYGNSKHHHKKHHGF